MPARLPLGNSTLVSRTPRRERPPDLVKLLVLAHTPPPLHGQSVMVQAMLDGLATRPGFPLTHVNFQLSRDSADIGRWRPGKMFRALGFALRAVQLRLQRGCDTLYYVPSPPGKRGALYRDWLVMLVCRPFFRQLVLHWHAAGLGAWLEHGASGIERVVTRALLGRADLSIVLSPSLRHDADGLEAQQVAIVPNGIADPGPPTRQPVGDAFQALFLGLCSEEKGLFVAAEAIIAANSAGAARWRLVVAGPWADDASRHRLEQLAAMHPGTLRYAGFVSGAEKTRLFAASHCLVFPTHYSAEAQPLVVIEALAHDVPVIASRWRALPDMVAPECGYLVPPRNVPALTDALHALRKSPPPAGRCRAQFLRDFSLERHLDLLASALRLPTTRPGPPEP